jgi:hypothetical protein
MALPSLTLAEKAKLREGVELLICSVLIELFLLCNRGVVALAVSGSGVLAPAPPGDPSPIRVRPPSTGSKLGNLGVGRSLGPLKPDADEPA